MGEYQHKEYGNSQLTNCMLQSVDILCEGKENVIKIVQTLKSVRTVSQST